MRNFTLFRNGFATWPNGSFDNIGASVDKVGKPLNVLLQVALSEQM